MLKRNIFTFLMSLVTCGVSFGATSVQRYYMEYLYVTPAKTLTTTRQSKLFAKLSSNGPVTNKLVYFYLFNSKHKTGTSMRNVRPKDESGEAFVTFNSDLLIKGESNRFKFFFIDSDGNKTEIWLDQIFDDEHRFINVNNLGNLEFSLTNIPAYTRAKGNFTASNTYYFENCYATNQLTVFNKFDIEMFTLSEMIDDIYVPLEYSDMCIEIPTIYGLFCDQNEYEISDGYVTLNLKLIEKENKKYAMSFINDLYVNPYTYEMSREERNGFVKTKYLYLPKNGFHDFESMKFLVCGREYGSANFSFTYDVFIESQKSRIGNCVTSQYCIYTGDAIFSEQGKELQHD